MLFFPTIILTFSIQAVAAPICPPTRSQIAGPKAVSSMVLKTAVVGYAERRVASKYADDHGLTTAEVEKRYAASGEIRCGDIYGQAQLVVRNDTVVTAAHIFFPDGKCKKPASVKGCRFKLMTATGPKEVEFEKVIESGLSCPSKSINAMNDWIVLKLKAPIESGIKPYRVEKDDHPLVKNRLDVVAVGKSTDFNPERGKELPDHAKHYGDCSIRFVDLPTNPGIIETDCDPAAGFSGGALLTSGADPSLLAIHLSMRRGGEQCGSLPKNDDGPYSEHCWASRELSIGDRLQEVLMEQKNRR